MDEGCMSDYQNKYPIQSSHVCASRRGHRSRMRRSLDPPLQLPLQLTVLSPSKPHGLARPSPESVCITIESPRQRMPYSFGETHLSSLISVFCVYITSAHPILRGADRTRRAHPHPQSQATIPRMDADSSITRSEGASAQKTSERPTRSAVCAPPHSHCLHCLHTVRRLLMTRSEARGARLRGVRAGEGWVIRILLPQRAPPHPHCLHISTRYMGSEAAGADANSSMTCFASRAERGRRASFAPAVDRPTPSPPAETMTEVKGQAVQTRGAASREWWPSSLGSSRNIVTWRPFQVGLRRVVFRAVQGSAIVTMASRRIFRM
ncbi:hypothetical protein B0H13DRAFT_2027013 [Mycena leptocephala]|nr:hypothetical protein B0H13DRAFT_2027013 [Mycena leptocephala]